MDLISRTDRLVYVKASIPRETFDALVVWFGTDGQALKNLRLDWQRVVAQWDRECRDAKADGSASRPAPGLPPRPASTD